MGNGPCCEDDGEKNIPGLQQIKPEVNIRDLGLPKLFQ